MWIVKNPEFYDVIVTTNMFGDIITDLSGIIQGGMGVAAGGNINPEGGVSMFEPMGGSAPKYTGTGKINPIAAINAVSMMLDQLGETKAAARVMDAIMKVTGTKMKTQAAGKMGYTPARSAIWCEALTATSATAAKRRKRLAVGVNPERKRSDCAMQAAQRRHSAMSNDHVACRRCALTRR